MKSWKWAVLLGILLLASCAGSFFLMGRGPNSNTAQIVSDGQIIRTVDLRMEQEFTVAGSNGGYNVVTVKDGRIAVTDASCPDHYCMHRGFCSGGAAIVCLPNKLVIRFLDEQDIDAAAG